MPNEIVAAPSLVAPVVGLLPTVRAITGDDPHWQRGFAFQPLGCLPTEIGDPGCESDFEVTINDLPASVAYVPNVVVTGGHCTSLLGTSREDLQGRITSMLEVKQGYSIARELWRGDVAIAKSAPNFYLAGGSPNFENLTPGAATSPGIYALGALQEFLAQCADGGRGMIHASRSVVNFWVSNFAARREGNLILDWFDNWIVADAGYDGSNPDGDVDTTGNTSWAYATGLVDVRLGPVNPIPGLGDIMNALDRELNDFAWTAWRFTGATWDGCCHAGINVNLCEPCCDPNAGS